MTPEPGASADAVRRLLPDRTVAGVERRVSTDQANLSIAVDDTWLVKWFARPVRRADLAVVDHLAALGFAHMPTHVGAVTSAEDAADTEDEVIAVVSELVLDATDGWVWYVDDVLGWIDGRLPLEPLVTTAARLGAITAELHLALASAGTAAASLRPLREAIAERRRQAVEHTTGDVGERLQVRLPLIDAALAALDAIGDVAVQRIHGDLHAGQFLRAGERLLVIDFDGDPMTASAERLVQQPVERDLAALLQSLDHVARVANKRRPGADVSVFVTAAIDAAEAAYRDRHAVDDRLLWPLRVAQELHEYAYAALHLPVWTYVPDAAMQALFPITPTAEAAPALGTTGDTDV